MNCCLEEIESWSSLIGELKKIYRRLDEYLLLQGSTIVTHCFTVSLNVS